LGPACVKTPTARFSAQEVTLQQGHSCRAKHVQCAHSGRIDILLREILVSPRFYTASVETPRWRHTRKLTLRVTV